MVVNSKSPLGLPNYFQLMQLDPGLLSECTCKGLQHLACYSVMQKSSQC